MTRFAGRIAPGSGAGIFGGHSESRSLPMPRKAMWRSPEDGPSKPVCTLRAVSRAGDFATGFAGRAGVTGFAATLPLVSCAPAPTARSNSESGATKNDVHLARLLVLPARGD